MAFASGSVWVRVQACFGLLRIYDTSFGALLVGQVGIAFAQPLILNGISQLATNRFPAERVPLATGLATLSMFLGMAAGLATTVPLTDVAGMRGMLVVHAVLAVGVVVAFQLWGHERPRARADSELPARLADVFKLLSVRELAILVLLACLALGVFNGFMTWLEPILAPRGLGGSEAGYIGGLLMISGAAGAVALPILATQLGRRKLVLVACVGSSTALLWGLGQVSDSSPARLSPSHSASYSSGHCPCSWRPVLSRQASNERHRPRR